MVILETRLKDGLHFLMKALKFRVVGSFVYRSTLSEVTEIGFGLLSPIFVVKNPPVNAGDKRDMGLISGL